MNHKLHSLRYWLLLALTVTAPLSFTPSIALPLLDFPSFRIGFYQILAIAFIISCLPLSKKIFSTITRSRLALAGALLIFASLVVGLSTSLVPARTLLYGASLVSLLVLGVATYTVWLGLSKKQGDFVMRSLLWSGIIFGGLAVLQLIIATFDRTALGTLCTGCSDAVFGFPRINLFAAEPQFFANSLFPVVFVALFAKNRTRLTTCSLVVSSLAIGLTFSRGALLALFVAFAAAFVLLVIRKQPVGRFLRLGGLSLAAIILSFVLLVASSSIRYHTTPYIAFNTTVSMVDHLTLGKLHIPQRTVTTSTTTIQNNFIPEGFIEASSNDRLNAATLAINSWNDSLGTALFGVGMGSLGAYVNAHNTSAPSNLTVYIWYILVLAELGIIGLIGILLAPFYLLWRITRSPDNSPLQYIAFSTTISFLVQLLTFGSYINVMYQYVFMGVFVAIISTTRALRRD